MPSAIDESFDIHARYTHHLTTPLSPILAAVAALTDAIEHHPVGTVAETLDLLSTSSSTLQSSSGLPLLVDAGVTAFRRWLVLLLEHPGAGASLSPPFDVQCDSEEFDVRKGWIVEACRAYVAKGMEAKEAIAQTSLPLLRGLRSPHVLVPVCDDVVSATLEVYAKTKRQFRVSLVQPLYLGSEADAPGHEHLIAVHSGLVELLRPYGIVVTEIPPQAVASYLALRDTIVLTASSLIYGNGATVAPLGTRQAAVLARAANVPFYIVAESYKQAGSLPLHGRQNDAGKVNVDAGAPAMDVTPPDLITSVIMEKGFVSPTQASDQFIKKWF